MALPAFSLAMAQPRFLISRDLGTFNRTEASRRACGPGIVPETSRLSVAIRCRSPIVTAGQWRFPLLETPAELSSLEARLRLRAATMRLAFTSPVRARQAWTRTRILPRRRAGERKRGVWGKRVGVGVDI